MPNTCVAPGCWSGYPGDSYKGRFFDFPSDLLRRNAWIRAMHRDDTFEVKSHSKLMSITFQRCRHYEGENWYKQKSSEETWRNLIPWAKKNSCHPSYMANLPKIFFNGIAHISRKCSNNRGSSCEQIAGSWKKEYIYIESNKITSLPELVGKKYGACTQWCPHDYWLRWKYIVICVVEIWCHY